MPYPTCTVQCTEIQCTGTEILTLEELLLVLTAFRDGQNCGQKSQRRHRAHADDACLHAAQVRREGGRESSRESRWLATLLPNCPSRTIGGETKTISRLGCTGSTPSTIYMYAYCKLVQSGMRFSVWYFYPKKQESFSVFLRFE